MIFTPLKEEKHKRLLNLLKTENHSWYRGTRMRRKIEPTDRAVLKNGDTALKFYQTKDHSVRKKQKLYNF